MTKSTVDFCQTVYENYAEEKIDLDIIIPDYSAAASRILKCDVTPSVTSRTIDGDRLTLEGICTVNLIYTDEETSQVKSISETVDFIQNMTLRDEAEAYRVMTKLRTSNVSCRLQNSRKISVKAVVGVAVKVMGNIQRELISQIDGCDVESLYEDVSVCAYAGSGEADIRISGETEADEEIADIIKCDGCIAISEVKPINDKVIIKGEVFVTCIYTSPEIESIQATLPFHEIIDVEGAVEGSNARVESEIIGIRCDIGSDNSNKILNMEVDMKVNASVYNMKDVRLLEDVYSRSATMETTVSQLSIESLTDNMRFSELVRDTVALDIDRARVSDIMIHPVVKSITPLERGLVIEGDLQVSVFAVSDDEYRFFDKNVPFAVTRPVGTATENMRCEVSVCAKNSGYSMPDDRTLEFKADLDFQLMLFTADHYEIVDDFSIDENNSFADFGSKIIVYYADIGEDLWDIAKKYHTSVDILKRDNQLADNRIDQGRMILISNN